MSRNPPWATAGLGRLAACFLDSIAALGLPGDGVGLNYHYGLFRQKFCENKQCEQPDPWLTPESWLLPTGKRYTVAFGGFDLDAVLYDIAIPGAQQCTAGGCTCSMLPTRPPPRRRASTLTNATSRTCLTSFLYPDDSTRDGQLLRVYQQYFMVSAGAQLILDELAQRGFAPEMLGQHVAIQINDTHPSMVIPELIRLLTARGLPFADAVAQVEAACAYTNHTILAEALETWPLEFIGTVAPQLVPILRQLDALARTRSGDARVAILDAGDRVHMAHMDIHFTHSTNGVAAPAYRDPQNQRAQTVLRPLPRKIQQQDQRRDLPPLAAGLRPGAGRLDHGAHRRRVDARRGRTRKTAALCRRNRQPAKPAGGQGPQQAPPGPAAAKPPGHR